MVLVLATLRAYPLFMHQIFVPLPNSSLQYSWSLELHVHKSKSRLGFCEIWGRLDVLELKQTPLHSTVSAPLMRGSAVSHGTDDRATKISKATSITTIETANVNCLFTISAVSVSAFSWC